MSKRKERQAARRLDKELSQTPKVDADLDALLPDYVRAELAKLPARTMYPDVFEYLRASSHARSLRDDLLLIEKKLLDDGS